MKTGGFIQLVSDIANAKYLHKPLYRCFESANFSNPIAIGFSCGRYKPVQLENSKLRSIRFLLAFALLLSAYSNSFAQYYYGPPPPPRKPPPGAPAQNIDNGIANPTGFLSVNLGLANPEGAFAQQFGSGYGGYAMPGFEFNFALGLPVNHSNFGVAVMVGSYTNTYNNGQWANNLYNDPSPNNYFYQNAIYPGQTVNVYANTSIMVGGYGTLPLGRLSIDARLMVGALIAGLPERTFQFQYNADTLIEDDVQPANPVSFAVDAGIGLRYFIGNFGRRKVCLMLNADYLFSSVSYFTQDYQYMIPNYSYNQFQITTQPLPGITPTPDVNGNISGTMPIALFSLTFGVGYQF